MLNYIYQLTILSGQLNDFNVLLMVIYQVTFHNISKQMCNPMWQAKSDLGSLTQGLETTSKHTVHKPLKSPAFPACPLGGLTALSLTQQASELMAGWSHTLSNCQLKSFNEAFTKQAIICCDSQKRTREKSNMDPLMEEENNGSIFARMVRKHN